MVSYLVSRVMVCGLGTLYPAYRSYKAIKSKDTKEYVKWMMYWIVFAIFITAEIFVDTIVGFWMPFYYEIKIMFLFWLLSPATKGASILYKKFVHPFFTEHEKEIDGYIERAKENGYGKLVQYGKKGLDIAADTMMKTAISGQDVLVQQLKRYKSDSSLDEVGQSVVDAGVIERSNEEGRETEPSTTEQQRKQTEKEKEKERRRERQAARNERQRSHSNERQRSHSGGEPDNSITETVSGYLSKDRSYAASMNDVYTRSTMASSSSLLYDTNTLPGRYYDGSEETLRNRPTSHYDMYEYSTRPYESTSNLPTSDDMTSSYTNRYESSTLPRARDSSHRYNTRNRHPRY